MLKGQKSRLTVMQTIVLKPCVKFEDSRPSRSEDMAYFRSWR